MSDREEEQEFPPDGRSEDEILAEAQAEFMRKRAAYEADRDQHRSEMNQNMAALAERYGRYGVAIPEPSEIPARSYTCACGATIGRGYKCCAACDSKYMADLTLHAARESLSPGKTRDWMRIPAAKSSEGSEPSDYEVATAGIRAIVAGRPLPFSKKGEPLAKVEDRWLRFLHGTWKRDDKNVLLIGPTGIGKSKLLVAIGHRIVDAAAAGQSAELIRFASGVRYMSAIELANARAQHGLGRGEAPSVLEAKRASLLLLDEVGFGDNMELTREILRARTDGAWRDTITASGMRFDEIRSRYGDTQRLMWCRGYVVDLFPRK